MSTNDNEHDISIEEFPSPPELSSLRTRRRRRMLDSAHRTFLRDGYHAATMQRVAEDAGVSKQTLYSYFGDKEEVFLALLQERRAERVLPAVEPALAALAGDDVEVGLREVSLALLRYAADPDLAALYRIALELAVERPAFVADLRRRVFRHNFELARSALERAVARGSVRAVDVEVAAAVLSGVVAAYGLVQPVVLPEIHHALSPERMAAGLADLLGHGLIAPKETHGRPDLPEAE